MKILLSIVLLLLTSTGKSQDIGRLREIDSLVTFINFSKFRIEQDTIIQDNPSLGLSMTTYVMVTFNGPDVIKYVNKVQTVRTENAVTKKMVSFNSFYFNKRALIKVEEIAITEDNPFIWSWYYSEDKPLYYSVRQERSAGRADLLLAMAKGMLKQLQQIK
jgi:hypothetical protein